MNIIDISVILLFTLLVVGCGLSFSSSGKNMKSFFSAGGALPWWMSGLSLFMSFFSAGTFVVWGSIAYKHGWVAVTIQWTMCIAGLIIGFFIAPKWQKTRVLTAAEFIKDRLGIKVQKVYTYIFLAIASFSTGAFLYPVAKIVEVSTGLSIEHTIIALGILILLYTAIGGLWAVIVTDILQFVVLTAAVLIVVPLSLDKIGGLGNFVDKAPEGFFALTNSEYSWGFIFAFGLYNLFFIAGNWAYIQRFTSVDKPKDAKKVGWLFGGLYLISPVVWMIAPMIYRALNPELAGFENEGAYLLMSKEVLPIGMLGLMLGAMIFATSSSINTSLNIAAGVITNDVFKHFKPNASQKTLVKVGRTATGLLGIITIIVALLIPYMGGVVEVVMTMAALTGGALFLPPIWLLFSRYQTGASILTTTIVSLAVNGFFKFISPEFLSVSLDRAQEMMLGVGLPVIILAVFELVLRARKQQAPLYQAYVEATAARTVAAELVSNEQHNSDNTKGIKVIGFGITAIGAIMLSLAFIADKGQIVVATMGAIIFAIGLAIFFVCRTKPLQSSPKDDNDTLFNRGS
ncbi:Na+:solute symporter [Psychrosphaera sp. B3R10]|uniref:sodium:solute symporter family protein n=1 Tax=unclassified Psychrosphaera TaxID=2641570 RepID=UPI001C098A5D|nr:MULTISPECIES: sodium:solute symporter family protein [unclassified Psychrosphaera]MBU2881663.1 Na+:solute symporter [Psychrosphaera sp. I2R16]MBU2991082.1 Na+:solute symporter [Psychrosphaera sp. B3R10]MDO6718793.1 sodium:solute symporter family protein [Psychrosphaera sp. 1_MG-2023]